MSLAGLTILVTGATDGIGLCTARLLAERGANVLVHGRDAERIRRAAAAVAAAGGRPTPAFEADLSSLGAARRLAAEVCERAPALDVLVHNAALGPGPKGSARATSLDGHELLFAVNVLAPIVLTGEYLRLAARPPRAIVNVASVGQEPIDWNDVMLEHSYNGVRAYRRSKLALVMWTFDLAAARPAIAVNALHPGTLLDTKMAREAFGRAQGRPEDGGLATVAVVERSLRTGETGLYFDQTRPERAHAEAYDPDARNRLKALVERIAGQYA